MLKSYRVIETRYFLVAINGIDNTLDYSILTFIYKKLCNIYQVIRQRNRKYPMNDVKPGYMPL